MTAYLGFQPNEGEYKVMGLAPYGDPLRYYSKIISLFKFNTKNSIFKLNPKYFSYEYSDQIMFNVKLIELIGLPPRLTENPLTQEYKDLAAAVQKVYEVVFCRIMQKAKSLTQEENLCLGGGCAYNGVANSQAYDFFKSIHIPFSPSDSGSSIGAALISSKLNQGITYDINPYTGPEYNNIEINEAIKEANLPKHISFHKVKTERLIKITAERLAAGQVCGWFQGRMEFGARALGNRSILADPRNPRMQEKINKVVKKREGFRPFAPSVIEGAANRYFDNIEPIPYMNQVVKTKVQNLPAVTHIDGTSRIQTVTRGSNRLYYDLLVKFNSIAGVPILLNTSFNFKDQTITMTPKQAIERFLDCEMDFLVIGNYLLLKNG
jgi:carbamoyltransferase